jgi:hypothetical protein
LEINVSLTNEQIEKGWRDTFSTNNPYCPCNLKSFTKAVRWAEWALTPPKAAPVPQSGVDAPERLYVGLDEPFAGGFLTTRTKVCESDVEYVRADVASNKAAAVAVAERCARFAELYRDEHAQGKDAEEACTEIASAIRDFAMDVPAPIASAEEAVPVAFSELHAASTFKDTPENDARIRCAKEFYRLFLSHTHPAAAQPSRAEVLEEALTRMDRARNVLTDGNPRPECNWGMLDTSDLRAKLEQKP